jgi:hypothetical protein
MDGLALAAALAAANASAPSTGGDDYTGKILSWDDATGVNSVEINGGAVSNLRVLQSGIGLQYQPGDVVLVKRRMSQWYILGKVAAPGAGAANQIQSAQYVPRELTSSTTFTDLTTVGPSVTVYIGSSRRCLVIHTARVGAVGNPVGAYVGGGVGFQVTGASAIGPAFGAVAEVYSANATSGAGIYQSATKTTTLTAADGMGQGFNTFTLKYFSANGSNPQCGFEAREITVIPF